LRATVGSRATASWSSLLADSLLADSLRLLRSVVASPNRVLAFWLGEWAGRCAPIHPVTQGSDMTQHLIRSPTGVLRLQGRVLDARGRALSGLRLAVVDADLVRDDLLAVGFTDQDGRFRLSFTPSEFNQDPFERESVPDLYIVFSSLREGEFIAVHRESFATRAFLDGTEDLGVIPIPSWVQEPVFLGHLAATPGFHKGALRLSVDDELVAHCLEEIAPLVEQLTGCRDLLARLRFELHDHMGAAVLDSQGNGDLHPILAWLLGNSMLANLAALYDPVQHIVHINLGWARRQGLDAVKVALGHELVHVAQFQGSPDLKATHANLVRESQLESNQARQLCDFMTNLEGYASYIEHDHLRQRYNCATPLEHVTPLQTALLAAGKRLVPELATVLSAKRAQYVVGREAYQQLAESGNVPRFHVSLPIDDI
jgi:hypothetical protein